MSLAERTLNLPKADTKDIPSPDRFTEMRRRLAKVEDVLSQKQGRCVIDVMGIVHDFHPGKELLRRISQADMVTLELTRGVVRAGLSQEPTRLLENNVFWQEVIGVLQKEGKTRVVRGVEVNQTPRVAWKRFSLHHGQSTLGSTLFTVEVNEEAIEDLTSYLTRDELEALKQYKWLITDTLSVTQVISDLSTEAIHRPDYVKTYPIPLCRGFSMVSINFDELDRNRFLTTFMLPPHSSLIAAKNEIKRALKQSPVALTEREVHLYSMVAMENFLLAPAELTDAREIVYSLSQFVRNNLKNGSKINCLHLGGAAHATVIARALTDCLPADHHCLSVVKNYDPRFGSYEGDAQSFFREQIPFAHLVDVAKIANDETTMDPQQAAEEVRKALEANPNDFRKRVVIARNLQSKYPNLRGIKARRGFFRDLNELYAKS